ncbi:LOW QUALITY PROTEIN: protein MODIFIED TRANSPORT TO THE VACUOLE 1-like [Rhodamnia argentea]|uniref:LOW QUALITY PROTEIN: protein MODIFIED TRANSPORT TO THE VACUOLE 1-like n=1 Tax=Rhodamnia argentea TaxID=178133 RepID=A0A8B8NT67_9MYRT|nr:LOW QUALITY PROTEIN: protein MODIFIED TRANSPORT TO THE VACUOLE 1-like [Rhodamnia argentea]
MDSSRRAVESYWRSRLIDAATSDEDKVTPVYKLEEICELLRSSHASIVKEVSEFILKRLDHKSPVVKQKALRLIKYVVGKSGLEFRREMQRHSVAVRQLFHYKGHPDPLKGDALNKAVRDTAHEAISTIFSEQDNKAAPTEDLNTRIQGFGNTNIEMPSEDKKSFLSEVVGLGSASIKQGLDSLTQGQSFRRKENGSYRGPNLQRSLTIESDDTNKYEPVETGNEARLGISTKRASGSWNPDMRVANTEWTNGNSTSSHTENKTREERLLETIVTSGGVRLQPTRDATHVFLVEAAKLDPMAISQALETKLQSPQWQVRVRAICVLDSIVRIKDNEPFSIVASYFSENKELLIRCSLSPQASLREKANKVLSFLDGERVGSLAIGSGKPVKAETATAVQMPDLIDTGESDYINGTNDLTYMQGAANTGSLTKEVTPSIYDLLGDNVGSGVSTSEERNDDDPFADVSFHSGQGQDSTDDIFKGMTIDDKHGVNQNHVTINENRPELFDIFGSSDISSEQVNQRNDVNALMAGLSVNESEVKGTPAMLSEAIMSNLKSNPGYQVSIDTLNRIVESQMTGISPNAMPLPSSLPFSIPPGMMFNPAFPSQSINYVGMGNFLAQQQILANTSNFQLNGNMNAQGVGTSHVTRANGSHSPPFPDIFQANFPTQSPNMMGSNLKKEGTKAFDFISDHLAAAKDSKRTL